MRFPRAACAIALGAALAASAAHGAADEVRAQVAARLKQQLPGLASADYALGSAAFDDALRVEAEGHKAVAADIVARGAARWKRKFKDGRSLASCFPNGGRRVARSYPIYDPRVKLVITLEMAVNQCLKAHREPLIDGVDSQAMGEVTAYLRTLSVGQKIVVRVPAAAEPMFEQGRSLYFSRLGQRNYACASCHVQGAGKRYADVPLSPAIGQATHWPMVRAGQPFTLQAQIRECLERMGAAPFAAGSEELNHLEYFLTYLSNGLPLKPNGWRPARP